MTMGEGRSAVEEQIFVTGLEIAAERHLVQITSFCLRDKTRPLSPPGGPTKSKVVDENRMDPEEAAGRGRLGLDGIFAVEEIVKLEPGIAGEPFIDPMELAVLSRGGGDLEVFFGHPAGQ